MSNAHSKQPPIKSQYKNIKTAQFLLSSEIDREVLNVDKAPQLLASIFNKASNLLDEIFNEK
jgi:hypothetical protein